MEKLFSNWLLIPDGFKNAVADYVSQNSYLPVSQVQGFERYRSLCGVQVQDAATITTTQAIHTWDSAVFDTNGFWNAGSPNRLTVPVGFGGVYIVTLFAAASTACEAQVQKNSESINVNIVISGMEGCTSVLSLNDGDFLAAVSRTTTGIAGGTALFSLVRQPGLPA